jgi:UDP-glucose 4-epimerase
LAALRYLEQDGASQTLNCGYGKGYSVRQVIEMVKQVSGVNFTVLEADRRPGDPACVTACVDQIQRVLDWKPQYADLETIVRTALYWEIRREVKSEKHPLVNTIADRLKNAQVSSNLRQFPMIDLTSQSQIA